MRFETNAVKLLVRWQGLGEPLSDLERELLLVNLYEENRKARSALYLKAHDHIERYRMKIKKNREAKWPNCRVQ